MSPKMHNIIVTAMAMIAIVGIVLIIVINSTMPKDACVHSFGKWGEEQKGNWAVAPYQTSSCTDCGYIRRREI